MKTNILFIAGIFISINGFSQSKYDFDIPARAKSDEGIFEWFIDALDSTSDSLLYKMFEMANTHIDSIHWDYHTSLVDSLTVYGQDYYSTNCYFANTRDKTITTTFTPGKSELDHNLFTLVYTYRDGITYLILVESF
jgi:hypothetical protein